MLFIGGVSYSKRVAKMPPPCCLLYRGIVGSPFCFVAENKPRREKVDFNNTDFTDKLRGERSVQGQVPLTCLHQQGQPHFVKYQTVS